MSKIRKYVGLDVHKDSISIAVAEEGREAPRFLKRIPNDTTRLMRVLRSLGDAGEIHCAYEAGPTGYGLQRALSSKGVKCDVIAPSEIPRKNGKRVKTDRLDAIGIAHHLRSGNLTPICIPDEEVEAMRDLTRGREDAKLAEKGAKHRLSKFLLRQGRRYPGKTYWTNMHLDWVRKQSFGHEAQDLVLREYLTSLERARSQVARMTDAIERFAKETKLAPLIAAFRAFRGIDTVTATALAFELIDLKRFLTAPKLMGYLGIVPSEHSSGETCSKGGITKSGNTRVRCLLIEAAHNNLFPPKVTQRLRKRQEGVSPEVIEIAWRAQERLYHRFQTLSRRGKNKKCIVTAMARELVGFIWSVGQQEHLLAN